MRYIFLIVIVIGCSQQSHVKHIYDYTPEVQKRYEGKMTDFNIKMESAINSIAKKLIEDSSKAWCKSYLLDTIKYFSGWTSIVTDIGSNEDYNYVVFSSSLNGPVFKCRIDPTNNINTQLKNVPKLGWVVFSGKIDSLYDYSVFQNDVTPLTFFRLDSVQFIEK